MAWLSWLSRRKPSVGAEAPPSSGLGQPEPSAPHAPRADDAPAPVEAVSSKTERLARRELLYTVVREAMVHAGVLSSSYKFKVLSLDKRGRQFLVMIDLASAHASDMGRLGEIEAAIGRIAKARHDITVKAVYWRQNDQIALGAKAREAARQAAPVLEVAAPARRPVDDEPVPARQPAAVAPPAAPVLPALAKNPFDPIDAAEVAAFKQALASGMERRPLARGQDGRTVHGPQSFTLLTGYEDTEQPDDPPRPRALSRSQYGDLR